MMSSNTARDPRSVAARAFTWLSGVNHPGGRFGITAWTLALVEALRRVRAHLKAVAVTVGDDPSVRILQGVKLFRDVRVGGITFRGSGDSLSRPVDYIFDVLPADAVKGKTVLDLGAAGGAICFAAAERGCERALGVETAEPRIRGAKAIQRITGATRVQFLRQDFYSVLSAGVPQFDLVFALNVLHHLGNPFPLLRRICRASREYVILETPDDVGVTRYGEYSPKALQIEGAKPAESPQDFVRFLAIYGFVLNCHRPSGPEVAFHRSDEAARSVYVFKRQSGLKSRDERLLELEGYRHARSDSYRTARSDRFNIDLRPGDALRDVLSSALGDEWRTATANYLFAGPQASGKTHCYEQMPGECHPRYNPKVFKFPNADGMHGLRRHLNPRPGQGRQFAQVLISTLDDDQAHCTIEQLTQALLNRRVVCLLLNVGFDDHVDRLYRREAERFGKSDADYDVSLRFDCCRFIESFTKRGIRYRVMTAVGASNPMPDSNRSQAHVR